MYLCFYWNCLQKAIGKKFSGFRCLCLYFSVSFYNHCGAWTYLFKLVFFKLIFDIFVNHWDLLMQIVVLCFHFLYYFYFNFVLGINQKIQVLCLLAYLLTYLLRYLKAEALQVPQKSKNRVNLINFVGNLHFIILVHRVRYLKNIFVSPR